MILLVQEKKIERSSDLQKNIFSKSLQGKYFPRYNIFKAFAMMTSRIDSMLFVQGECSSDIQEYIATVEGNIFHLYRNTSSRIRNTNIQNMSYTIHRQDLKLKIRKPYFSFSANFKACQIYLEILTPNFWTRLQKAFTGCPLLQGCIPYKSVW